MQTTSSYQSQGRRGDPKAHCETESIARYFSAKVPTKNNGGFHQKYVEHERTAIHMDAALRLCPHRSSQAQDGTWEIVC